MSGVVDAGSAPAAELDSLNPLATSTSGVAVVGRVSTWRGDVSPGARRRLWCEREGLAQFCQILLVALRVMKGIAAYAGSPMAYPPC
ncbi:MAG: hypothetical protein H6993_04570 [Pseudomonadales bacterium]|nr:hypothetical protein [Pseudomonadales bacterium]MCP5183212.1 hypothetical protein [Pseudomonadales bacterium]